MSAKAFETPEGSDAIHEAPSGPGPDIEFPDWHPDLNGPHWQPTGGPNDTPFSIAIVRPGSPPKSERENKLLELYRREMENADQIIIPDDEEEEAGPPHRDPDEGSTTPRKIGTIATGWEVWLDDSMFLPIQPCSQSNFHDSNASSHLEQRTYYYNRATSTTKYSWSKAEVEAEELRLAQVAYPSNNERSNNSTTKPEAQRWGPEGT
jgi:hypothetical protein